MSALATPFAIDLRAITPRDRHPLVFGHFDALQPGQSMQLVNDHDPQPLLRQFALRSPGQFEWSPLESGPSLWRVAIKRVGSQPSQAAADSCCSGGACCG